VLVIYNFCFRAALKYLHKLEFKDEIVLKVLRRIQSQ